MRVYRIEHSKSKLGPWSHCRHYEQAEYSSMFGQLKDYSGGRFVPWRDWGHEKSSNEWLSPNLVFGVTDIGRLWDFSAKELEWLVDAGFVVRVFDIGETRVFARSRDQQVVFNKTGLE